MLRFRFALVVVVAAALSAFAGAAHADSRTDHPFQLQFDTGGFTVGYHFNRNIYVGYTQQPRLFAGISYGDRAHEEEDEREVYGQDGVDRRNFEWGQRSSLEVRWSPWPFGLYFAGGALMAGSDHKKTTYDDRARVVGDGAYGSGTTDLLVKVKSKSQTTAAAGVGYNHVFQSGFSLGAGVLFGLRRQDEPEVEVIDRMGTVTQADLDDLKDEVIEDEQGVSVMIHLAIGWNF